MCTTFHPQDTPPTLPSKIKAIVADLRNMGRTVGATSEDAVWIPNDLAYALADKLEQALKE